MSADAPLVAIPFLVRGCAWGESGVEKVEASGARSAVHTILVNAVQMVTTSALDSARTIEI